MSDEDKIRKIERKIDNYYSNYPIMKETLSEVIWYLMLVHDNNIRNRLNDLENNLNVIEGFLDNQKNALKYALKWVTEDCHEGRFDMPKLKVISKKYNMAEKLLFLAYQYDGVVAAFTSWSRGEAMAELVNNKTIRFKKSNEDIEYDILDRLILKNKKDINEIDYDSFSISLVKRITNTIKQKAVEFIEYEVEEKVAKKLCRKQEEVERVKHILPDNWKIWGLCIKDIRKIFSAINTISSVHNLCHLKALLYRNIKDGAPASMIIVNKKDEWTSLIKKYSGLKNEVIEKIFDLLVYDKSNPKRDISLQPFIYLDSKYIGMAPGLVLGNYFERNFIQLLAKKDEYSDEYNATTEKFEKNMTNDLEDICQQINLKVCTNKNINDKLPDLDIGIYEEATNTFFIGELKWTIPAAETNEVIQKDENVQKKGYRQGIQLLAYARRNKEIFWSCCFSDDYPGNVDFYSGVICKGYAGSDYELGPNHALKKAKKVIEKITHKEIYNIKKEINLIEYYLFKWHIEKHNSLLKTVKWIKDKGFLPKANKDFTIAEQELNIGPFTVYWPGVTEDSIIDLNIPGL